MCSILWALDDAGPHMGGSESGELPKGNRDKYKKEKEKSNPFKNFLALANSVVDRQDQDKNWSSG